ncbi:hypothetical protein MPSEU_000440200 [Mayamaea pseudoterrestris]|nr:hypothetical protein MPSEU_000440200 [Mayamaea pseudoterrestris]
MLQSRSVSSRRPGAGTAYRLQAAVDPARPAGNSHDRRKQGATRWRHHTKGTTFTLTQRVIGSTMLIVVLYLFFSMYSFLVIHRGIDEGGETIIAKTEITTRRQSSSSTSFQFDRAKAEAALKQYGSKAIFKPITAFIEPPLNDTIPGTGSRGDLANERDKGTPPNFIMPLPLRKQTPHQLQKVVYKKVQSCHDMPGRFPVDRGLEIDPNGNPVVWNVADEATPENFAQQELPHCPVESDPWLSWIHDVFPSQDGSRIEFVAQNKRRCRTGTKYTKDVNRLTPQVALMQPISVERITEKMARTLAPDLWQPSLSDEETQAASRYRLASHNESSGDGMFTRFVCQFHATTFDDYNKPQTIYLGETLSQYPFNYELVSYRKNVDAMLTAKGKDTIFFWTSNIRFHCPVPDEHKLRERVASGELILSDGTPTVYVNLVPIRTSVRYDEHWLTEEQIGPRRIWGVKGFNATERWGPRNVLPHVQASGRWENIPICLPPQLSDGKGETELVPDVFKQHKKPHYLSACVWASAQFKTRGASRASDVTSDTFARMNEWIEFHLLVGFDQIYLYDNSGAQTNETSLREVADRFPGKVTYIDWPSIICNNNVPAHDNTGERSSQYAAENSCRTRYGPFTEWISSFDSDEYLVPMGNYTSLKDVLSDAANGGTNVLTFRSTRGKLRPESCHPADHGKSLKKRDDVTFLQAYNCDPEEFPKPNWAERARKQIYRPSYVHYHFVHYSTVPDSILVTYAESKRRNGTEWRIRRHEEHSPSERVTDELHEALMVHTKTIKPDQTNRWRGHCHKDFDKKWLGCLVAVPWPNSTKKKGDDAYDQDGLSYNCFVNQRIEDYWLPKLTEALASRNM